MPGYMGNPVRADLSTAELIDVFDNEPMEFAPGDQWNYNNSGYVLLGAIIEAVSGQSYEEFIADNIATPLELEATFYGGPKIIPKRAAGYVEKDERLENAAYLSMTQPHAAGSLLSTTGNLFAWHKALTGGEFIHDESFTKMIRPYVLNDGESYPYGYGLGIAKLRGRAMIGHGGGINGFTCFVLWLPEEDVYVAVLTNREGFTPKPATVARKIAAMVIGDPYPPRVAVDLSKRDRQGLTGKYEGEHFPPIQIHIVDGDMVLQVGDVTTETLLAESRDLLFWRDSLEFVEVEWDGSQARRLLFYSEEGVPPDTVERLTD
jgi:D-alanyl-D-alanine carboxypeptidase